MKPTKKGNTKGFGEYVVLSGKLEVQNGTYHHGDTVVIRDGAVCDLFLRTRKIEPKRDYINRVLSLKQNPPKKHDLNSKELKVNLNRCTVQDLMEIPGVGEKKALTIAEGRPFFNRDEAVDRFPILSGVTLEFS